jgi:hypothetical protein
VWGETMTAALPVVKWKPKRKLPAIASRVTFEDAALIADRCFNQLGRKTISLWRHYNHDYFNGVLEPTPVLYIPTSPWGHWVGCHIRDRNIYLMYPSEKRSWGFVRGVLLHEMVHQFLEQSGVDVGHDGTPWCQEIMRLSKVFGRNIWAGKYTVTKVHGRSQRTNKPNPDKDSKAIALNQDQISKWPHSIGLEPPDYSQL